MGIAEIAYTLDVDQDTLRNWAKAHPEFFGAITRARGFAQGWWEMKGRMGIDDRNFNANAYRLQMINRFPSQWRDVHRTELSGDNGKPLRLQDISDAELLAMIAAGNGPERGGGDEG